MQGYAVIDCETTGLNRMNNDKMIEIAVVHLDLDLNITGKYETLLNPNRDVGLVSLHGINGLMASRAPVFSDIMESLAALLNDRVIIAHNASFDTKFIRQAYESEGIAASLGDPLDTMRIAKDWSRSYASYKLDYLCSRFEVPLINAHTAMGDALATAQLFVALVKKSGSPTMRCSSAFFYNVETGRELTTTSDLAEWKTRDSVAEEICSSANLIKFMQSLPEFDAEMPEEIITTYLSTIHKTLLNNSYTIWERGVIVELITKLSLSKQQVIDLNEEYIFMLICKHLTMYGKEVFSAVENDQLVNVAAFTGISIARVQQLITETLAQQHHVEPANEKLKSYFHLNEGDGFVLTGEDIAESDYIYKGYMPLELYLERLGYLSKSAVTKLVKTVICYDPYSRSNKAVKARQYGIPILTEETVISLLEWQG